MGNLKRGVYKKFVVRRTDGRDKPGQKHHGCEYFVLDVYHDKFAIPALGAYAKACFKEYPILAAHLRDFLNGTGHPNKGGASNRIALIRDNKP